jgi:hypothetical protein
MESPKKQVDVRSAVDAAIRYVKDLYFGSMSLREVMLEEVEFSEATDQWIVTVGFSMLETQEESTALIRASQASRERSRRYKIVNIDAKTGNPLSMKRAV